MAQYPLLLFLCFVIIFGVTSGDNQRQKRARVDPPLCQAPPEFFIDGEDPIYNSRGKFIFLALMEVNCQFCHRQINGIKNLKKTLEDAGMSWCSYIIIAPKNESASWVQYWREALKRQDIQVYQETAENPVWSLLHGHNHDFFVYDRCGRLIYFIPNPQSNLYYHYTVSSLFAAHHYQHVGCGYCVHDRQERRRRPTPNQYSPRPATNQYPSSRLLPPRVRAYLGEVRPGRIPTQPTAKGSEITTDKATESAKSDEVSEATERQTIEIETATWPEVEEPIVSAVKSKNTDMESVPGKKEMTSAEKESAVTPQTEQQTDEMEEMGTGGFWEEAADYEVDEYYDNETTETDEKPDSDRNETAQKQPDQQETAEKTSEVSSDSDSEFESAGTTETSAQQIPKPEPQASPTESTKVRKKLSIPTRKPKFIGGASCAEYSDEVCLEQQKDIGLKKRHLCCYKGIYLTGKCVPKLCSEDTFNVCCFQKFIQARYLCCHNSTLKGSKSDEFSHCCYDNFVLLDEDDSCCPGSVAKEYWNERTNLYELCLPNVDIDFKDMVLDTKLRDNSLLELRLAEHKVLQYTCPYSRLRDSFYYWQPPEEETNQNTTETDDAAKEGGR